MVVAAGLAVVCEYEGPANANSAMSEINKFLVPNMRQRLLPFFINAVL
jgi:hypothetical protein